VSQYAAAILFDVKLHRLLSRHATVAKQLSPKLRAVCGARDNERYDSHLELAALDEVSLLAEIFCDRGKLGVLLLQLSPAFSPKTQSFAELELLISKLSAYSLAIEFRNRDWVVGDHADATFAFLRQHAVTLVLVDTPHEKHVTILPSGLKETTNRCLNYLRLHGPKCRIVFEGKTVTARFDYD
jgi:uncharacterized protein YecE (DUF72 family)